MPASKTLISGKVVGSGSVVLGVYGFEVGYRLPLYVLPSSGKGRPRSPATGRDAMITPIWLAFGGRDGSPGNAKVERKVSRDMANDRPEDIAVAWQEQLWRRCVPRAVHSVNWMLRPDAVKLLHARIWYGGQGN